tara:strand:- start:653 stop:952 length:300 start_codon:yes stop_codon:yes gene_type:complete
MSRIVLRVPQQQISSIVAASSALAVLSDGNTEISFNMVKSCSIHPATFGNKFSKNPDQYQLQILFLVMDSISIFSRHFNINGPIKFGMNRTSMMLNVRP